MSLPHIPPVIYDAKRGGFYDTKDRHRLTDAELAEYRKNHPPQKDAEELVLGGMTQAEVERRLIAGDLNEEILVAFKAHLLSPPGEHDIQPMLGALCDLAIAGLRAEALKTARQEGAGSTAGPAQNGEPAVLSSSAASHVASSGDGKLTEPAWVGNTSFGVGCSERLVIDRAQREFKYQTAPEQEKARIEHGAKALAEFQTSLSTTPQKTGDAYFIVGYEDTPGFAIARSKDEVRAALCDVIYGGSLKPEDEETKEELDSHMEWFEDEDRWSIDRSHWSISYEIGGIEAWRFPAKLLACVPSATPRITAMPLLKRLREQRDEVAQVVREIRTRMQSVHAAGQLGQEIAEKDRAWLAQVDAALAKCPTYEQQLRYISEGIGMSYDELIAAVNNRADGGKQTDG